MAERRRPPGARIRHTWHRPTAGPAAICCSCNELPLTLALRLAGKQGHYIMRQDRRRSQQHRLCWARRASSTPLAATRFHGG
jgi:hypothetical protein